MTEMIIDWSDFAAPWDKLGPEIAADLKAAVDGRVLPPRYRPAAEVRDPLIKAFEEKTGASKADLARYVRLSYKGVLRWFRVGRVPPSRREEMRRWLAR